MSEAKKELLNPVTGAPRRGRPSKTAAVYVDGVMIVNEAEREEINAYVAHIDLSVAKAKKHITDAAMDYFALGQVLAVAVIPRWPGKCRAQDIADALQIPYLHVCNANKIYLGFRDNPETLEGMAVSAALGFLREQKKAEKSEPVQYALPADQGGYNESENFGLPTLSGITLNNYRFRTKDGKFYLLHKGFPTAIPVASLTVDEPKTPSQQAAYNRMLANTQKAFEEYYAVIEAEQGAE